MTKTIVLGGNKVPIVFDTCLLGDMTEGKPTKEPSDFLTIELICRGYDAKKRDVMLAYDLDRNDGAIYFGYWNSGSVQP